MIELLHELRNSSFQTEAFRHLIMSQQRKREAKTLLDFYSLHNNETNLLADFMRILNSYIRADDAYII